MPRTGASEEPNTGCKVSFQVATHPQPTLCPAPKTVLPSQSVASSRASMRAHILPKAQTPSLRNPHGLGLPHSWVQTQLHRYTREGNPWTQHFQAQGAPPLRSRTPAAPGLGLRARRRLHSRDFSARLRHPRPGSASSAVTVSRGPGPRRPASPAVPVGGPQPQGGAPLAFAPAPGASGLRWRPLRAACLHANGPPLPAFLLAAPPPRARPAPAPRPAGRKSLNW